MIPASLLSLTVLLQTNLSLKSFSTACKPLGKSRHSRIVFDEEESKALLHFAKRHHTTVSPVLVAIIQVRLALDYATQWPIPADATHSDFFPVNIRPALVDPRRVGMSLAAHGMRMNIGQALSSKSKQDVHRDHQDIILRLANEVSSSFHDCKDPQFRADLTETAPLLFAKWADWVGQGKYDRSSVTSRFYSDGKQDVYFPLSYQANPTNGLSFDLIDYDLDVHYTDPVL